MKFAFVLTALVIIACEPIGEANVVQSEITKTDVARKMLKNCTKQKGHSAIVNKTETGWVIECLSK